MNDSIPFPPEGDVDVLSASGKVLLRLPHDKAEGYVRRHVGTRIADAPPAGQDRRQDAIGAPVRPGHTPEAPGPSWAFYAGARLAA